MHLFVLTVGLILAQSPAPAPAPVKDPATIRAEARAQKAAFDKHRAVTLKKLTDERRKSDEAARKLDLAAKELERATPLGAVNQRALKLRQEAEVIRAQAAEKMRQGKIKAGLLPPDELPDPQPQPQPPAPPAPPVPQPEKKPSEAPAPKKVIAGVEEEEEAEVVDVCYRPPVQVQRQVVPVPPPAPGVALQVGTPPVVAVGIPHGNAPQYGIRGYNPNDSASAAKMRMNARNQMGRYYGPYQSGGRVPGYGIPHWNPNDFSKSPWYGLNSGNPASNVRSILRWLR